MAQKKGETTSIKNQIESYRAEKDAEALASLYGSIFDRNLQHRCVECLIELDATAEIRELCPELDDLGLQEDCIDYLLEEGANKEIAELAELILEYSIQERCIDYFIRIGDSYALAYLGEIIDEDELKMACIDFLVDCGDVDAAVDIADTASLDVREYTIELLRDAEFYDAAQEL